MPQTNDKNPNEASCSFLGEMVKVMLFPMKVKNLVERSYMTYCYMPGGLRFIPRSFMLEEQRSVVKWFNDFQWLLNLQASLSAIRPGQRMHSPLSLGHRLN